MVYIKKVYGQSQATECYFCDKRATTENSQGAPTCIDHKSKDIGLKKCLCGKYLEIRKSKFGIFFLCSSCGPISIKKAKETENNSEYNINKAFRPKEKTFDKEKTYTLEELEDIL